ncbi:hypothetical protein H8356DRAFT_1415862 [Neocallimastix lanati (nom. inval.)]|nr:hypothetical protein H8356DRAFT_1415862 [Neocallimastix sp. JGI-2020a]
MNSYSLRCTDNKAFSLSLKCIKISIDSSSYLFGVDEDLSLSKANMKDISLTPFYIRRASFQNNYTNPLTNEMKR